MSTEAQFNVVVLAVVSSHQLFVATWLLLIRRQPRLAGVALAALLLVNAGCEWIDLLQWLGVLRRQGWLAAIYYIGMYALPPLLYVYTYALTPPATPAWQGRLRWLVVGPLAAALCVIPYLMLSAAQQASVLEHGYLHIDAAMVMVRWTLQSVVLVFPFYYGVYLLVCFLRLRRHLRAVESFFSNIENKTLSWLRWMLLLLCIALAATVVNTFAEPMLGYPLISDTVSNLIEAVWIYPLTFLALAQPRIFSTAQDSSGAAEAADTTASSRKYMRSALTETDLARIAAKLHQVMQEQRLYRSATLTLRDLGDRTGITQNYLSQTLNIHLGCSFFDYINRWRIEDACRQLADSERGILMISEDVGFHSRSTFNAAFKKVMKQTPTAYRQQAPSPDRA